MSTGIVQYNVLDSSVRWNPHPIYAKLRSEAPVYQMDSGSWLLTRYDDCEALQGDSRFAKDYEQVDSSTSFRSSPMGMINRHMLTVDPPDHTRLRGLVHKAFTPRIINEMNARVQEIADNLLAAVAGRSETDLVADFAFPLPITVIAELLGVPFEDRDKFRRWSQTIVLGDNYNAMALAAMEFMMYMHELFDQRRAAPKEDLISNLIQAEEAGDKLAPEELVSMIFLLLVAGHETTVNLIANGTLTLLRHPEQMRLLRDDPTLIKSAVEEMLRFESPVSSTTNRWAMEDVEIRGQAIQKGDLVVASLLAANRDPEVFENPDTVDIRRNPNRHMAFGYGIHYCLGAPLARMEGAIAINTLLREMPKLQLAIEPQNIEWNETLLLRSMKALPVSL
jgi:cytochrome P450 PksS